MTCPTHGIDCPGHLHWDSLHQNPGWPAEWLYRPPVEAPVTQRMDDGARVPWDHPYADPIADLIHYKNHPEELGWYPTTVEEEMIADALWRMAPDPLPQVNESTIQAMDAPRHHGVNFGARGHGKVYAARQAAIARARTTFHPECPTMFDLDGTEIMHPSDMRRFVAHLQEAGIPMQTPENTGAVVTKRKFVVEAGPVTDYEVNQPALVKMFPDPAPERATDMTAEQRRKVRTKNKAARKARKGKR